jgi:hypothetical protein
VPTGFSPAAACYFIFFVVIFAPGGAKNQQLDDSIFVLYATESKERAILRRSAAFFD